LKEADDLKKIRMPVVRPEHQRVIFGYLSYLFAQVQTFHTLPFDDVGQKVEPHDVWPPLALNGQYTSARYMMQLLLEDRPDIATGNDFEAEDGDRGPQQQLLRAVIAANMVHDCEVEDVHAGPIGQLVLTQLDRSKPRPLRDVAIKLKKRLMDLARISNDFAEQFFETQKAAIVGLYDQVGQKAAISMASEFVRQWGPRIMPWLETPLYDTLLSVVSECGQRGAEGLPLLEAFSFWVKGEEYITQVRRNVLKESAIKVFADKGVDTSGEAGQGLQKFVMRCESSYTVAPLPMAVEPEEPEEPRVAYTPGKRLHGKQTVHQAELSAADEPAMIAEDEPTARKRPRTGTPPGTPTR